MKKRFVILGILIWLAVIIFSIKPLFKLSSKLFWNFAITWLEKEEQNRKQMIENGDIVPGKDTILIWGNVYEIGHYSDGNHFEIYTNNISETILEKIIIHKVVREALYIISDEGYAVINKENLCKVYIIIPENEFINGYSVDEQGNKIGYSRFIENEHVQYLANYNEFSKEEQAIFSKLKEKVRH